MVETHTGEHIAERIGKMLSDFLLDKIPFKFATTDCGSNIKKCFKEYLKWPRIPCFCHVLHNFLMSLTKF